MRAILFIALLASTTAANASGAPEAPGVKPSVVASAEEDKMVCKREPVIGSNVPGKRVCKPKSQILAEQAAAREAARDMTTPSGASSNN